VYNGPDSFKNEGPWCWMFTDPAKKQALVFAINHRELNKVQTFDAKLRWLDERKTYLVEEITQLPSGSFNYGFRGEFTGAQLKSRGLPVDLESGEEHCAAFFVQEKASRSPQVLYADATVVKYTEEISGGRLTVQLEGTPNAIAQIIVVKPGRNGAERRAVTLDATGKGSATFDAATVNQPFAAKTVIVVTTDKGARDTATAGAWNGKYGSLAAWIADEKIEAKNSFSLTPGASAWVWGAADTVPRVLALPAGVSGSKKAGCWTAPDTFTMRVSAPASRRYKLSVYVMDYDNGQRGMDITVKSADGTLHDRQSASVAEMGNGIYLSWEVIGSVTIKAQKNAGCNAAVSGVFVDEAGRGNADS